MNDLLAVPQNLLIYFVYNCNFDILPRLAQFNAAMLLNVCCKLASWPRGQILFLASHFPPDENNESGLRLQNCLQFFSLHFTQFSIFNIQFQFQFNTQFQNSIFNPCILHNLWCFSYQFTPDGHNSLANCSQNWLSIRNANRHFFLQY